MKNLVILLIVFLVSPRAFALQEFYSQSKSVRALGMGNAYYGLSNDEHALFYNPTGLSFYENGTQAMVSISPTISPSVLSALDVLTNSSGQNIDQVVDNLSQFQGDPLYGGASIMPYYAKKNFSIALLIADAKLNFTILGRDLDTSVDVTGISDSGLFVGYSREVVENIYVGATLKGLFRVGGRRTFTVIDIAQNQNFDLDFNDLGGGGAGFDADLGVTYELPRVPWDGLARVSMVLNNVVATDFSIARFGGKAPPGLVRMLTLSGYARFPGVWAFDHFDVIFDLAEFGIGGETDVDLGARRSNFFKHVNFGVEAPLTDWFSLRTGFRQGYWSAGLGLNMRFFKMDLATWQEELFSSAGRLGNRRFAVRFAFGVGSAKPAVAAATESKPRSVPVSTPAPTPAPNGGPLITPSESQQSAPTSEAVPSTEPATSGEAGRDPSSVQRRVVKPEEDDDRFNVDSYVEKVPPSYNYSQ